MSIVGSNKGKYLSFGCSAPRAKGSSICGSGASVSRSRRTSSSLRTHRVRESRSFKHWIEEALRAEERSGREEEPAQQLAAEAEVRAEHARVDTVGRA